MKARIALAEDNPDQRRLLTRMIEVLGYQVICAAANGEELLAFCSEEDVDVVVVDLDMPIIDGLEAAEVIAEKRIPIVLISGLPEAEDVVVEKEPIVARLSKPATKQAIKGAIEVALGSGPPRRPR